MCIMIRFASKNIFSYKNVLRCSVSSCRKYKHIWSSDKVVNSPFEDIVVPNLTLVDYAFRNLDKWSDKIATVCGITGRQYSYNEIHKHAQRLAISLRKHYAIDNGDSVAVILPNMPEYPSVLYGILAAGGTVTTVNPIYTAHEIKRQLLLSEAKVIISTTELVPVLKESFNILKKEIPIITVSQKSSERCASFYEIVENTTDKRILNDVNRNINDVCYLPYSSGTTGLPKGVELTNKNIIANAEQQNSEVRIHTETTADNQDTILAIVPMFHSYGLSMVATHKTTAGLRLVTLPSFNPKTFLDAMLKFKINLLCAAPPLVLFLGSHPEVTSKHLQHLRTIMCGAAPLPMADIHKLFKKAGREIDFVQAYGLTETSPLATSSPPGFKDFSSVGFPLPSINMRVVDDKLNNLGPGEVGELLIKGPNVMKGYRKNPEANKNAFIDDKWFRSGDLAKIDGRGVVVIADRLKELIKVKGFQVPPAELEAVIKEHPDVLDAAVVGVPDDKTGERPKAFIVPQSNTKIDIRGLAEFVNNRVAAYKQIKDVQIIDVVPKNPSGKILRRVLLEKYT